jgi:hypothetical protein
MRGAARQALEATDWRRATEPAATANAKWDARQRGARKGKHVRINVPRMQHGDSMSATPSRKSYELPHRVRPAKTVNRKATDWVTEFGDPPGPWPIVMKAHGVDLESVAIDPSEQLDELPLRSARDISVDEDGNREASH